MIYIITGIILEAYSPLGSPGNPLFRGEEPRLMDDPVIKEISEKYGATCAQVDFFYAYIQQCIVHLDTGSCIVWFMQSCVGVYFPCPPSRHCNDSKVSDSFKIC